MREKIKNKHEAIIPYRFKLGHLLLILIYESCGIFYIVAFTFSKFIITQNVSIKAFRCKTDQNSNNQRKRKKNLRAQAFANIT